MSDLTVFAINLIRNEVRSMSYAAQVLHAYKVITAIVSTQPGRTAFIASRGLAVLAGLVIRQQFQVSSNNCVLLCKTPFL